MKNTILSILFLIITTSLYAQKKEITPEIRSLNSFNLNLLGDGSLGSINYERFFVINERFMLIGKLGMGYNIEYHICLFGSCDRPRQRFHTIPHHLTGVVGNGKVFFEFGMGGTVIKGNVDQQYLLYPILGFRVIPLESDQMNLRIYGTYPFTGLEVEEVVLIPIGISIGINI